MHHWVESHGGMSLFDCASANAPFESQSRADVVPLVSSFGGQDQVETLLYFFFFSSGEKGGGGTNPASPVRNRGRTIFMEREEGRESGKVIGLGI